MANNIQIKRTKNKTKLINVNKSFLKIICKPHICILFPAMKANVDALFTTNIAVTVVALYHRFAVSFRRARITSLSLVNIFWCKTRRGWIKSLNREVIHSRYFCKWLFYYAGQKKIQNVFEIFTYSWSNWCPKHDVNFRFFSKLNSIPVIICWNFKIWKLSRSHFLLHWPNKN